MCERHRHPPRTKLALRERGQVAESVGIWKHLDREVLEERIDYFFASMNCRRE